MLWKFGLVSYSRFKIHCCLAPRFAVQWIKTTKFTDFIGVIEGACGGPQCPQKCLYEFNNIIKGNMKLFTKKNLPNLSRIAKVANLAPLSFNVEISPIDCNFKQMFYIGNIKRHHTLILNTNFGIRIAPGSSGHPGHV